MDDAAARALLADVLVWDTHAGLFPAPDSDLSCLDGWRAAGVDHVALNVGYDVQPWTDAVATLSAFRRRLGRRPDVALVRSVAAIEAARAAGQIAVSFDLEGANALNGDPGMVALFKDLGVGQMLLAYNLDNEAAGGCHDRDHGLTGLGREIVAEMNRVGMIVDASHAGPRTLDDLVARSTAPVVATHSNARKLVDHERNLADDQIRAIAATGGVVGVNGISLFLGDPAGPDRLADHAAHIAAIAGPGHVALGLDWVPPSASDLSSTVTLRPDYWPPRQGYGRPGLVSLAPSVLPAFVTALMARGWSGEDLAGLLGGNVARVARQVWGG